MKQRKMLIMFLISVTFFFIGNVDVFAVTRVSCGNVSGIPEKVPQLTNDLVNILQIAVPVILVFVGSIDLIKGIMAGKEDEIKKGQQIFIKRLIIGALIFFLVVITKFVISVVDNSTSSENISNCIDCFLVDINKCSR